MKKCVLQELFRVFEILLKLVRETFDTAERDCAFFSLLLFPHYSLVLNIIMNTFTAKNEKETQSLLSHQNHEEGETKRTTFTSTKKKNALTLGGLAAVGILGLASSKSSSFGGSAAPFNNGSRLGQTQSTIRLSVGCSPQDVLSLLPFEPKSWRGARFILLLYVHIVSSFIFLARSNFLSRNRTSEKQTKELLDNEIRRVADIFSTLYYYIITFQIIISKQHQ